MNGAVLEFNGVWQETWVKYAEKPYQNSDGVYYISSAKNLAWLATQDGFTGECKQMLNIDLGRHTWEPINNFKGTYNGNGYWIQNLHTVEEKDKSGNYVGKVVGLFGTTTNATLKNISILSGLIYGRTVGTIVAEASYGAVTNCISRVGVNGNNYAGGIVGKGENLVVTACYNYGNINEAKRVGGIAGNMQDGSIKNCYVKANIEGNGILGEGQASISRSGFDGKATGEGIGGENISDCFANDVKIGLITPGNWNVVGGRDLPKGLVI